MLFNFNEARDRLAADQYDVCICGAGPAGITTARKLAAHGKKVILLEGGGESYSDQSQDNYKGRSVGHTFWLETSRLRFLGGTSNHWSGLCGLLDPIDFETRDLPRLPGWPISREQVLSAIDEAQDILDIAGKDLSQSKHPGFPSPSFDGFTFALSAPTRFFEKYGAELRHSRQIDAFYNANLIDLVLDDSLARVKSFRAQNYKGQISDVSATQYVLALGGIENARMLLNANKQVPVGLGNHSGMVGRCFMEHLNVPVGRFLVTNPEYWQTWQQGVGLDPSEAFMRQKDIGNGNLAFSPNVSAARVSSKYGRLGVLREFVHQTGCFWPPLTELARQIVEFNCPGDGLISSQIEQEPNLESRVSLTDDVDFFGLRRVQMNWQLSDRDLKTIRTLSLEAAKEMASFDLARVQLAPFIVNTNLEIPYEAHCHHMGTTRMSSDQRYGVVDENCRVHGIQNLYVAGSSVFPTGGCKNPTLTIVLLALRLGDFLSKSN